MVRHAAAPIRYLIFAFALVGCAASDDRSEDLAIVAQAASTGSIQNGSFDTGTSPWVLDLNGGASATFTRDCSTSPVTLADRWSYRIDVATLGADGAWDVTLRQSALALGQGKTITVSFDAVSPVARTIEAGVQELTSPWTWYSLKDFSAPGDSAWHTYTWQYTQPSTDSGAGLNIDLGQMTGSVRIDNVVVRVNGGANLVSNGSFENGSAPWALVLNGGAAATATRDCSTSSTGPATGRWSGKIATATLGSDGAWDVQLRQSALSLQAGGSVTVSFNALSNATRTVEAGLQNLSSPWNWYSLNQFSVPGDGAWHAFHWTYTQGFSDANAAFNYDVGQATGDVWVDGVAVTTSAMCTPTTCAAHNANCGTLSDGCGGTLNCGTCTSPHTCGGGGVGNVCGGGTSVVDAGSDAGSDAGGGSFMPAPPGWSYNQLSWVTQFGYSGMGTAPSAANEGTFVANGKPAPNASVGFLNDWNFGLQEKAQSVWSVSGSFPYWGSSSSAQSGSYSTGLTADYDFPGNVFQTSTGANASLFGGYSPQAFHSTGSGLSLFDHYVGGPQQLAIQSNGSTYFYEWTSGVINTEGKRYFPSGGATEMYGQVKAQMAGPNNGSWSAIWMLPDQAENGTGQEIDLQEYNVSGPNPNEIYSHVQAPAVQFAEAAASTPLYAGLHVYGWDLNSATQTITVYLDGVKAGTFTGPQVGAKYFLILHATVSSGQASWQKSEGFVTNSTADMAMRVAEVQIYQR